MTNTGMGTLYFADSICGFPFASIAPAISSACAAPTVASNS
jgi:hypothetical protein